MLRGMMEDKRLDFDAPLLSVRRSSAPPGPEAPAPAPPRRSALPFYKSEVKTGPVRDSGVVPFVWEHTPGQPKDGAKPPSPARPPAVPKPPPARIPKSTKKPITSARTRRPVPAPSSDSSAAGEAKARKDEKEPPQKHPPPAPAPQPIAGEKEDEHEHEQEDEDAFSDAVDTLSRTESIFMNCSVSGISGITGAAERPGKLQSGSFATDPQVRDFMMGRFLPAAQAMAESAPQCVTRKPRPQTRVVERERGDPPRRPSALPSRYGENFVNPHRRGQEEVVVDSDDEDDYVGAAHFSSKACGLLPRFCLNSSLCLLNPVPGMKARGRPPPPGRRIASSQFRNLHQGPLEPPDDENSWEAVYKHKLGLGYQHQVEDASKLTSESNHLTYWSDSQTADGSSPHRQSNAGAVSPYRNEAHPSPFHEGKSFLGVPKRERRVGGTDGSGSIEKNSDIYSESTHRDGNMHGSDSMSPVVEKFVDSLDLLDIPHSKSSSAWSNLDVKGMLDSVDPKAEASRMSKHVDVDCEIGVVSAMEGSLVQVTREADALRSKESEFVGPDIPLSSNIPNHVDVDGDISSICKDVDNYDIPLKTKDQPKNEANILPSLLPLQLPNAPSDSWLFRTLPSVSSKNPPYSFLGIKFPPKKQPLQAASTNLNPQNNGKPVKVPRQIRFADVIPSISHDCINTSS